MKQKQENALPFRLWVVCFGILVATVIPKISLAAEDTATATFTLKSSIEHALRNNPDVLISKEGVSAAQLAKKGRFSDFLPKLSGSYGYMRRDEERESFPGFVTTPQDQYTFTATLDQTLFSGFSKLTAFEISKLDLQISEFQEQETLQDLVFAVKSVYFDILQEQNLTMVAEQAVEQLTSHVKQARDFYEVGLIPRNDLLEAEVELANARLELVVARNRVALAKTRFNVLLNRPVDAPVSLETTGQSDAFQKSYSECVALALEHRTEKQLALLALERSREDVDSARRDYYPAVNLQANYLKTGDSARLDGGRGIYDDEEWNVGITASWTFWEWGKTAYGVRERLRREAQSELEVRNVDNKIRREIKSAFLKLEESRQNIVTEKKAVEQAKENLRITQAQYREQVVTSTEVLDAQTLLTQTQNNYFNALNSYNLSKAALVRAVGTRID